MLVAVGSLLLGKMLIGSNPFSGLDPNAPATSSAATPGATPAASGGQDSGLLGGLSGLLNKLVDSGHGDTVNSWISNGPNKPIDPNHLGKALGPQTVNNLANQTGMQPQDLLTQLAQALPGIIDKLTANGQLPTQQQIAQIFQQQQQQQ
ncbi:YidB family protein [Rhodoligotrophos defluvii]|uniref:YidB family protein n=1 Tax=Rhodoligotrophos defluvii TaxID=2561934 RepID=UPI0030842CBE